MCSIFYIISWKGAKISHVTCISGELFWVSLVQKNLRIPTPNDFFCLYTVENISSQVQILEYNNCDSQEDHHQDLTKFLFILSIMPSDIHNFQDKSNKTFQRQYLQCFLTFSKTFLLMKFFHKFTSRLDTITLSDKQK